MIIIISLIIFFSETKVSIMGEIRGGPIIKIDVSNCIGRINPLIFGINHRYHNNGTGCWNAERYYPIDKALDGAIKSGITIFRFPGGTVGTPYHWVDGIGPVENRTYSISGFTGEPLLNNYGFDEHMFFVEKVNATTTIVVNFGSGTALEAAAWVAYANGDVNDNRSIGIDIMGRDWKTISYWAQLREENQRRMNMKLHTYNITYWEIGNEIYGNWEYSWTHNASLYALGGREKKINETVGKYRDWRDTAARSDGIKNQIFYIKYPPVSPSSQRITVDGKIWREIENLSYADYNDEVYEFDDRNGEIRFGDGIHGKIPPTGAVILASYECYHDGFIDFYNAMKFVDEDIKIGSCFSDTEFIKTMGGRYLYDFLILHNYYHIQSRDLEAAYHEAISIPFLLNRTLASIYRDVYTYAEDIASNIEVAVTEYNFLPPLREPSTNFGQSLTRAIYIASMLHVFINNKITLANLHCFLAIDSGGLWRSSQILVSPPYYTRTAASYTLELFSRYLSSKWVYAIIENSPTYNITYRDKKYVLPYLESLVCINDDNDKLTLLVINKHPIDPIEIEVQITGFNIPDSAVTYILNALDITSYNDPYIIEKPKRKHLYIANREIASLLKNTVIIGGINIEVDVDKSYQVDIEENTFKVIGKNFNYSFPAHSVTIIELSKNNINHENKTNYTVEFYIDGILRNIDHTPPYTWLWDEIVFGKHEVKAVTYDDKDNKIEDKIGVMVFNFGWLN